jgi:capsular exopolysaccharide synthesis family protein
LKVAVPIYEVDARLVVHKEGFIIDGTRPIIGDAEFLATQAQVVGSPAIIREALHSAPLSSLAEVEVDPVHAVIESLKVTPIRGTDVLSVQFWDSNLAEATRLVEAIVARYRDYIQSETLRLLGTQGDTARIRQQLWDAQVRGKELAQTAGDKHPEVRANREQIALWEQLLNEQQQADQTLAASQAAQRVRVIEGPAASVDPYWPRPVLVYAGCAIIGLLAGTALAWARDQVAPKVRSSADVQARLGLRTLGGIPRRRGGTALYRARLARESPTSAVAEAFRGLRTRMRVQANSGRGVVLQIVSAREGEGKTTVAANLAFSFAQLGRRVAIVDADLRRGILHEIFDVPASKGLTVILRDGLPPDEAIQRSPLAAVDVLTRGPDAANPAELLGQPNFEKVLEVLRERYDVVLLDTPPLLPVADAAAMAPSSDGVLLTIRCGYSELADLVRARDMLGSSGTALLGVVLNGIPEGARNGFEFRYPYRSSQVRVTPHTATQHEPASVG